MVSIPPGLPFLYFSILIIILMTKYNGKLILFLVFVVIVASLILLAYYMWGYTIGVQSINGGNFT